MQLLLVRHGETEGNVTQVMQGIDDQLTERGRRQARAIAKFLATRNDIHHLYTSPLVRAVETAQAVGAMLSIAPELRPGLAEINVGRAVGYTLSDWLARFPKAGGVDYAFPDGESGRQLGMRVAAELDHIITTHRHEDGATIVISHGGALAWGVAHLLGEVYDSWPHHHFDNCSLTEIAIPATPGEPVVVVCHNEIGHLALEPTEEFVQVVSTRVL